MRRKEGKGCRQTVHKYLASGCAQGLLTIIKCADLEEGNEPFQKSLSTSVRSKLGVPIYLRYSKTGQKWA